jgi:hypothetical protein
MKCVETGVRMAKRRMNDVLRAVVQELLTKGLKYKVKERGSGHQYIEFTFNGRMRKVTISSSASDHRAGKNMRAQVRRILREEKTKP